MISIRRRKSRSFKLPAGAPYALLLAALFSAALLVLLAPPSRALEDVSVENYGDRVSVTLTTGEEAAMRELIKKEPGYGGENLKIDPRLVIAARELAGEIQSEFARQQEVLGKGRLSETLRKYGVYEPDLTCKSFTYFSIDDLRSTIGIHFNSDKKIKTHMGIGLAPPQDYQTPGVAVVILYTQRVALEPFPRNTPPYATEFLTGRLVNSVRDYTPAVMVTFPDGKVERLRVRSSRGLFEAAVSFDHGPGTYRIEVMATGNGNNQLAALLMVDSGFEGSLGGTFEVTGFDTAPSDEAEARSMMVEMINQVRVREGLRPVLVDGRLERMAKAHSQDMKKNDFFGHLSPSNGSVDKRARAAGISKGKVRENLARSSSLVQCMNNLLNSPAHRAPIIDPEMTYVGVGVVFDDSTITRHYYVTQEFSDLP